MKDLANDVRQNRPSTSTAKTNVVLLLALYVFQFSLVLFALLLYKKGDKSVITWIAAYPVFLFGGGVVMGAALAAIVREFRRFRAERRRELYLTAAMNIVTVVGFAVVVELSVRLFCQATPRGQAFIGTPLLPHSWETVALHYRNILKRAPANISYFVPDPLLGWTIGPNRQSSDGLYSSSTDGVRSPRPGVSFAERHSRYRIAAVGDSYTFGLEVTFEDSWGHQLERQLGPDFQILNFGVDGYGVDQAYLRYVRDVRHWQPNVVLFGFINHDLERTMAVYSFVSFPDWEFPFSKPRFRLDGSQLELLNTPLLSPQAIFSKRSITELPFIEYDPGYDPTAWRWSLYHHSYLLRFLVSRYPRWPEVAPHVSEESMIGVNTALLLDFARLARAAGSVPLVVYFPSRGDFPETATATNQDRNAKQAIVRTLEQRGVGYMDLTRCLQHRKAGAIFIPNGPHYTASSNRTIAECLRSVMLGLLHN